MVRLFYISVLFSGMCLPNSPAIESVPRETHKCAEVCAHMRDLGCEEGQPLSDGTPCTVWCTKTEEAGMPLGLSCLLTAKNCNEVQACAKPRKFK